MKKLFLFLIVAGLFTTAVRGQVKIQSMPTHDTKPTSAWIPIVTGGVNKKVRADSIASIANAYTNLKFDSATAYGVKTVKVAITSAEILNMFSAPKTLIPAPGAGKIISIDKVYINYHYGTITYTTHTNVNIYDGTIRSITIPSLLAATENTLLCLREVEDYTSQVGAIPTNQPAIMFATIGNPAAGNGTMDVYVTYSILTL